MRAAFIFAALSLTFAAVVQAQGQPKLITSAQSKVRPYSMERVEQWTLTSRAGRIFEISVARPKDPAPAGGFPALFVLDPSTSFATLTEMVRNHELMFGPTVVVGIGYPSEAETDNRRFDMSPPTDLATLPQLQPEGWGPIGGADAFLAFLQDELRPMVEKSLPLDKKRQALFGHSLGGLFVLHVLFNRPEAFDTYIAGSPSIWWGKRVILSKLPAFQALQTKTATPRRLLITVGELEGSLSPEERRSAAKMNLTNIDELVRNANMVANAAALAAKLQPLSTHGLQVEYASFPNETHNSVIPAYLARGTRFALSNWFN